MIAHRVLRPKNQPFCFVFTIAVLALFALINALRSTAHTLDGPSFLDTIVATRERLIDVCGTEKLATMSLDELTGQLTADERHLLGTTFINFHISKPAWVHVVIPTIKKGDPFWLNNRGFIRGEGRWNISSTEYETWSRQFPSGHVGLGLPSLSGIPENYAVVITPAEKNGPEPEVSELYPGHLRLGKVALEERLYVDSERRLSKAPDEFIGHTLIFTQRSMRDKGKLYREFRLSPYPSSTKPDNILLTWTDEPDTTQTIRWRTNAATTRGALALAEEKSSSFKIDSAQKITAITEKFVTKDIVNDPVIHLHTVRLTDLKPGTTYTYTIGDGTDTGWIKPVEFTTAPGRPKTFSFIYLGDAQNGFMEWGRMMKDAVKQRPDAAFVIMAGDLVTRGNERDDWDDFFHNANELFDRRPIVPVIGNHEYQGGKPLLYQRFFTVRDNGPKNISPGHAYSFEYGNALVIVLDSNKDIPEQASWLEQQLRDTKALWKFVSYHHPAYASRPGRSYPDINKHWVPIFDRYHVDLALQGHDHAYLRTYPMNAGRRVGKPNGGTIYLITVSGTKLYEQGKHEYTEVGFTKVPTWQILDIKVEDRTLRYRAYDVNGKLRDEFVIEK